MKAERCGSREHHCQEAGCDKPVEFLITWPDQSTLWLCAECRKKYNEESAKPTGEAEETAKPHKGKAKKNTETTDE